MTSPGKQKVLNYPGLLPASALPPTSACLPALRGKLLKWLYWLPWESQDEGWITSCICEALWLHSISHSPEFYPAHLSSPAEQLYSQTGEGEFLSLYSDQRNLGIGGTSLPPPTQSKAGSSTAITLHYKMVFCWWISKQLSLYLYILQNVKIQSR